jgi:hypothetical protein
MTGHGINLDLLHCPLGFVTERTTPPVLGFWRLPGTPKPPNPGIKPPQRFDGLGVPHAGAVWAMINPLIGHTELQDVPHGSHRVPNLYPNWSD